MSMQPDKLTIPTKALSVRAPWWWFILHGGKDIENRDRRTSFRGTVYLHASKWWRAAEVYDDTLDASLLVPSPPPWRLIIDMAKPHGGCLVGRVDVVDCVTGSDSPWFFGPYGFKLVNPVALPRPVPCKGMLGFFGVPEDVRAQVRRQIEVANG